MNQLERKIKKNKKSPTVIVETIVFSLQVAQEIWVCENQTITKWKRDILAYKEHLKCKIEKQTHNV